MSKTTSGFTIVELLVVIAVIGILTTIGLLGFGRYQMETRDTQRAAKTTVLAEALEKFYDKNGEYPSCAALTGTGASVALVLPGTDLTTLLTPKSATGDTNSIECADLTGSAGEADIFAYVGDGSTACTSGAACLKWTLKYKEESTNSIKSVQSRRNTDIATSNSTNLSAVTTGFTTVSASWPTVDNALSYEVQSATNNSFTVNLQNNPAGASATPSLTIGGLAYNTQYFFRVRAIAADSQGSWSNTTNATTWMLTQTTVSAVAQSFTQINTSWGAVSHATSYEVQRATNSGFTAGLVAQTTAGTTSNFTGLTFSTSYYFRVRALGGGFTGAWSATDTETTWGLSTPSVAAVTNSSTVFTTSWAAISHATSYVIQLSSDGTTWSTGWQAGTTGPAYSAGGAAQGYRYYVRVQAINGAFTSAWSNIANTVTTIDNPAAYGMASDNTLPNWNYLYGRSDAVCPAGTTPSYDWYANGSFWVSGTQYRAVNYGLSWNTSVTIQVASRCTTAIASSGFIWANNTASMSLPIPSVWVSLPGDSVMYWGGTCPKWATAAGYNWWTNGRIGASGSGMATQYGPPGTWWGDGNAHAQLWCDGPWGRYTVESTSMYGPGCNPTPTKPDCYY